MVLMLNRGPTSTDYEGALFTATLSFPYDYPLNPPKMKFISDIWHPNGTFTCFNDIQKRNLSRQRTLLIPFIVYPNGEVCISILHAPGDDPNQYESSVERWSPVQSVEKILLSVVSMLAEPNVDSPANIDAGVCIQCSLCKLLSILVADGVAARACIFLHN